MTHPSVEAIAEHLEGTLDQADDQHVREHLRGCAECTDRAAALHALPGLLRTAGEVPSMPEHLARRVDDAIAAEAYRRADAPAPVAAVAAAAARTQTGRARTAPAADGDPTKPVADLGDRRRRRRRVLAGGLLAAAAATVVAVGLGDLLRTGDQATESAGSARPPSAESLLQSQEPGANNPGPDRGPAAEQLPSDAALPLVPAGLIADVAAAHDPRRPGHERRGCVASALGSDAARSGASYAVSLPGGAGAGGPTPGVVWLRPNDAPAEAVLMACSPRPRVLDRRGLGG